MFLAAGLVVMREYYSIIPFLFLTCDVSVSDACGVWYHSSQIKRREEYCLPVPNNQYHPLLVMHQLKYKNVELLMLL